MTVEATIQDDRIWLKTPYKFKNVCKSLPGRRWHKSKRRWHVPATPATARAVLDAFSEVEIKGMNELKLMALSGIQADKIREAHVLGPLKHMKTEPRAYQKRGSALIMRQAATLLDYDMGTGKTKCVIDAICNLPDCRRVLVICPANVVRVWQKEVHKHAGADLGCLPLRDGPVAKRARRAAQMLILAEARGERVMLVINYAGYYSRPFREWAEQQEWDMVILDEIHKIKAPGGKQSRAIAKLRTKARRRVGLTGTPMPHSPLDIYGQYRFLDPGIFGTSFALFRARYAIMGGYGGHEVMGWQNRDELHEKLYSIALKVKKRDVLDLPPVTHESRYVPLCDESRRLYDQLERGFVAEVKAGEVTVVNALSRLLRMHQVACGHVRDDQKNLVMTGDEKQSALLDVLQEIDESEPVVVFGIFRPDLERVAAAAKGAGRDCLFLHGDAHQLEEWQEAEDGEVLAVQISAGSLGVDLTRANYGVFFSHSWSLGDYQQALARLDRHGQTSPVTFVHLLAEATVDERIKRALGHRQKVIESVLGEYQAEKMPHSP